MKFGSVAFFKKIIKLALFVVLPASLVLLLTVSISFAVFYNYTNKKINSLMTRIIELEKQGGLHVSKGSEYFQNTDIEIETIVLEQEILEYESKREEVKAPLLEHQQNQLIYLPDFVNDKFPAANEIPEYKTAYLTFDDGPSWLTGQILDILDDYEIKATFFVVNKEDERERSTLQDIAARGHAIGMHSATHEPSLVYASQEAFLEDMYSNYKYIYDVTGVHPDLFRFIGGSKSIYNETIRDELVLEMLSRGFSFVDWNSSGEDSVTPLPNAKAIVNNVLSTTGNQQQLVVLLHDSGTKQATVQALPEIIEALQARDYVFDSLGSATKPVRFIN